MSYQPPNYALSQDPTPLQIENSIAGSSKYEPIHTGSRKSVLMNREKSLELKILDEKLGKGHIIYFMTILSVLLFIVIGFLLNADVGMPLPMEIFRIVLVGLLVFILYQAIVALRQKRYYNQINVVHFLKWYAALFSFYGVLKMILFPQNDTGIILGHISFISLLLLLIWASKRVCSELKKREEILAEMSFNSFFF